MQQTERERERDQGRVDAPPEHELMSEPAARRPTTDEALGEEVRTHQRRQRCEVPALALTEGSPAATVEHRVGRPAQPYGVPIDHPEHQEHDAVQVADQCCIEPHQLPAAEERDGEHECHAHEPPRCSFAVNGHRRHDAIQARRERATLCQPSRCEAVVRPIMAVRPGGCSRRRRSPRPLQHTRRRSTRTARSRWSPAIQPPRSGGGSARA